MSFLSGTSLEPIIIIKNNTSDEISNISIIYSHDTDNKISFNNIPAGESANSTLQIKNIAEPIDLSISYSHNSIIEKHIFFKNFSKDKNIIKILLEITIENNNYICSTTIERDPIDNSIIISTKYISSCKKILLILGSLLAVSSVSYYLLKLKK